MLDQDERQEVDIAEEAAEQEPTQGALADEAERAEDLADAEAEHEEETEALAGDAPA